MADFLTPQEINDLDAFKNDVRVLLQEAPDNNDYVIELRLGLEELEKNPTIMTVNSMTKTLFNYLFYLRRQSRETLH